MRNTAHDNWSKTLLAERKLNELRKGNTCDRGRFSSFGWKGASYARTLEVGRMPAAGEDHERSSGSLDHQEHRNVKLGWLRDRVSQCGQRSSVDKRSPKWCPSHRMFLPSGCYTFPVIPLQEPEHIILVPCVSPGGHPLCPPDQQNLKAYCEFSCSHHRLMHLRKQNPTEKTPQMISATHAHLTQVQPFFFYHVLQSQAEEEVRGQRKVSVDMRQNFIVERCPWPETSPLISGKCLPGPRTLRQDPALR